MTRVLQFGLLLALGSGFAFAQSVTLRYFYDGNHQLIGVLDSSGNYVQYVYDPAGNPTQINRSVVPSNALSILSVSPQQGGIGASVTIQGQGFSPTPGSNTVNFNGVAATVISASATQLVVTVPSGAHTGPLSVTVGGVTAQGGIFTVQATLVSIAVTPSAPAIALGGTQQFTATGTYSDTTMQNLTASVTWSTSAPGVATIANGGLATSVAIGSTTIGATYNSTSGTIGGSTTLTVKAVAPVSIAVAPNSPTINVGTTQQLTATGTYSDNSMQNVTTMATWSSSNPAVATVSNSAGTQGQVIGLSAGMTTITAMVGSVSGTATVTVSTPPSTPFPRFLYVTNGTTGISVYSVNDSTGQLRPLSTAPLLSSSIPPSYGTPPVVSGSFLYVSSTYGSDLVDGYALNANNGSLTLLSGSPFWAGIPNGNFSGHDPVVVTPSGQFAYVVVSATSSSPPQAVSLSINSTTGALTVASQSPFGGTNTVVQDIAMDPQGRFLYVLHENGLDNTPLLHVLALNPSTGAATPVTGSPFSGGSVQSIYQVVPTPSGNFLYGLDPYGRQIQGFSVNGTTGALTALPPVSAGFSPAWITVTPSSNYLYAYDTFFPGSILGFSINSTTGALTTVNGSPFATPVGSNVNPVLATEPSGKYLYVNVRDNSAAWWGIAGFSINPGTGALSLISSPLSEFGNAGFAFLQGTAPVSYTPAFAYAANNLDNDLSLFSVNASSGALNPLSGSPLTGFLSPRAVAIDSQGKFALTADQNGLRVFAINPSTGSLSATASSSGANPAAVAVDPLDRFVFTANQAADNVSAFQFNALNGTLTQAPGSPFPASATPVALALDPAGQILLAANFDSDVSQYYINQINGALSSANSFVAGTNPIAVAIEATGHYAYVVNQGSNNISVFSIHIGAPGPILQLLNTLSLPEGTTLPQAVTIDPTGHFLYVAGGPMGSAGTVSAYTINSTTGNLAPIAGSPFAAGQMPSSVMTDPSGAFVYVVNSGSNNVSVFSINPATGALSPASAPVFSTGATPVSIGITPNIH